MLFSATTGEDSEMEVIDRVRSTGPGTARPARLHACLRASTWSAMELRMRGHETIYREYTLRVCSRV